MARNMARGNLISSWHLDKRLDAAASLVPAGAEDVLDVGCGEGYFLEKLTKRQTPRLVGVDTKKENVVYAAALVPKAKFIVGDGRNLPFGDSVFDCSVCLEVIDHVPDYKKIIKEMKRVTKNKGRLIISFPDTSNQVWRFVWALWTRTFGRRWAGTHVHNFNELEFREVVDGLGIKILKVKKASFGWILVFSLSVTK